MPVSSRDGIEVALEGRNYSFCSEFCKGAFLQDPPMYLRTEPAERTLGIRSTRVIGYFSMEAGIDDRLPTYAGGLGILAGDTIKSFADLEVPAVGVTLLHRKGYFEQRLDSRGNQSEHPVLWNPDSVLRLLPTRVQVHIEGRPVVVAAWEYDVTGVTGYTVPVFFLDTDLPENSGSDRELSSYLYGGDERYRLAQEAILGIGGVRMLRALGHSSLARFHMNEGHSSLLALELLRERMGTGPDFASVRDRCVFTTHTPVSAGHDQFDYALVRSVLGDLVPLSILQMLGGRDRLNMTLLALNLSQYVNGVAKRHSVVSQEMFPGYPIHSITNGVHSRTWTSRSFAELYDRHIPGWAADPFSLRHAMAIPDDELWKAHGDAKSRLIDEVNRRTKAGLDPTALTLGFARRATPYKRHDLILSEPAELAKIASTAGPLQIVFAGKAHPRDEPGKDLIRRVVSRARELQDQVRVVWLEDYDCELAKLCTSGVDVWVNTPLPPLEASGTSGMKAAHNGVPSLSILDGWWIEGCIEGITGWAVGRISRGAGPDEQDARNLYGKLGSMIAPLFYRDRRRWVDVMRHSIALNASYFNSHRMVQQYLSIAYA